MRVLNAGRQRHGPRARSRSRATAGSRGPAASLSVPNAASESTAQSVLASDRCPSLAPRHASEHVRNRSLGDRRNSAIGSLVDQTAIARRIRFCRCASWEEAKARPIPDKKSEHRPNPIAKAVRVVRPLSLCLGVPRRVHAILATFFFGRAVSLGHRTPNCAITTIRYHRHRHVNHQHLRPRCHPKSAPHPRSSSLSGPAGEDLPRGD